MNEKIYNEILSFKPTDEQEKTDKESMLYFIRTNEDVLTRNNKIGHFTVSSWIFNKDKTKVLMIYHNTFKSWAWIGGHVDGNDDFKKVLIKEIEEESGVKNPNFLSNDIYSFKIITNYSHIKKENYIGTLFYLYIHFVLEADENESLRIKEDENSGVRWVKINEINDIVSEKEILPHYNKLCKKINFLNIN